MSKSLRPTKTGPKKESPTPIVKLTKTSWKNPIYHSDFCDVIQDIYICGATDAEVAADLGVCKDTFYEWRKKYPEFERAVKRGKILSHRYWAKLGQAGAQGELKVDSKIWLSFMRNCHNWDRDQIAAAPATAEQVDDMKSKMAEFMETFKRDV